MKLLSLRFKNLNSLYGEWFIDFEHPEYQSQGIFAITGPTGAGKSTLLDAICLALYGRTPRLKVISKSTNEIMSRQSGECFAEVTFSSQSGVYRCHWSQTRARKKPDGALQDSKHEIADALTGKIIEAKKKDVARVIEDATGMDFDRFTRSVLLAQGSFAAFLQASADERSPILEQITGTEIYSTISQKVHERQRTEKEKLDRLNAELSGVLLLSDEEVTQLNSELTEKTELYQKSQTELEQTQNIIKWQQTILTLNHELNEFNHNLTRVNDKIAQFEPKQLLLDRAIKAAEIDSEYTELKASRDLLANNQRQFNELTQQLPDLITKKIGKQQQLSQMTEIVKQLKQEQIIQNPILNQVRALDISIANKRKNIDEISGNIQQFNDQIKHNQTKISDNVTVKNTLLKQKEAIQLYINNNPQDEQLISQLAVITEQCNHIHLVSSEITELQNKLTTKNQQYSKITAMQVEQEENFKTVQQKQVEFEHQFTVKKQALSTLLGDKLLREYRAQRDSLNKERYLVNKIVSLEFERNHLITGEPCPLCGSTEHPYSTGNTPELSALEQQIANLDNLILKAEELNEAIEHEQKAFSENNEQKIKLDAILTELRIKVQNEKETIIQFQDELSKKQQRKDEISQNLLNQLKPWQIDSLPEQTETLLTQLKARLSQWQDYQAKFTQFDDKIIPLDNELIRLNSVIEQLTILQQIEQDKLTAQQLEIATISKQRNELYADKSPDLEEQKLRENIVKSEQQEAELSAKYLQAKEQCSNTETQIDLLAKTNIQIAQKLTVLEHEFVDLLTKQQFADENVFLSSRLTAQERNTLSAQAKALTEEQLQIRTNITDRQTRLKIEQDKSLSTESYEILHKKEQDLLIQSQDIAQAIGSIKQQLAANEKAKISIKDKQITINLQQQEYHRWLQLHALIGSADGKKYRNFAQGLTFEFLVAHANKQLAKMTDRYLLIRNKEQPLELDVIDNYQAGEIRSTKNLSGGESFIVSLALALGLSKISSQKIRVDSLFLDEGFGTLDEDALDTALETLSNLQQEGKLIGVISHVGALKESINLQIEVTPLSNGRSHLRGVGVKYE